MKNYYEILQVTKNSTPEEIKKSYKKLAKKYHPDISKEQNAAEKFAEIQNAYEVLGDEEKKSYYDRFGGSQNNGYQGNPYRTTTSPFGDDIFNGSSRRVNVKPLSGLSCLLISFILILILMATFYFIMWALPFIAVILVVLIILNIFRRG